MRRVWLAGLILIALFNLACKGAKRPEAAAEKGAITMAFTITSAAFKDGAPIPKKYSCDGEDVSPPLAWTGVPAGAKSLALICRRSRRADGHVDALGAVGPAAVHAVAARGRAEGRALPGGMKQGKNSFPRVGYGGPCPPPGKPHRYFFKLYALDAEPAIPDTATKAALEGAMKDHILAQVQLMGTYGR